MLTRPQGWYALALCTRVAREHPDWPADRIERRALAMYTLWVATDDDLATKLRHAIRIRHLHRREVTPG